MKNSKKMLLFTVIIMAVTAIFALTACEETKTPTPSATGAYYLSVYENGAWTSYKSESDIPASVKFCVNAQDKAVYTLSIKLEEGAQVKIAQIGSTTTYGADELFSALTALTKGSNNALVVVNAGTFVFTLNTEFATVSYTHTPSTSGDHPTDAEVLFVDIDNVSGAVNILYNETKQLTATVTYDDDTTSSEGVTWISSAPSVATVVNGLVTAVTAGTTQIKAECGGVESDPVTVNVNGTATLDITSHTLKVDESKQITATLAGGATKIQWTTSDESVATVSDDGLVTGVAPGSAEIKFFYNERPGATPKSITCAITVSTPVEDIAVASTLTVAVNGTQNLTIGFVPTDATNKNYTHTLTPSDEYISVVKNGTTLAITGLKQGGPATITVTSEDGNITKTCTVTVIEAGSEFVNDIDPQTLTLNKSETGTLTVSGSGISSVAWSTTSSAIVSVAASADDSKIATVTGAGFGTATITATVTLVSGSEPVVKTLDVMVAPNQMWVYGDIIEGGDGWNMTDTYEEALEAGTTLTKSENGIFTAEIHLPANKDFRLGHDNFDWKGIRWEHISSVASEKQNAIQGGNDQNSGYNVRVTKAGTYSVTADFTKIGKPVLKISVVSIDVTSVTVNADETMITSSGDLNAAAITVTITPDDATYTDDDIVWTLTNENLVNKGLSNNNKTITVTALDSLAEGGTVRVTVTVKGKTAYIEITVVAAGAQTTPVSTIAFEQTSYAFNVNNNGAFNGTGTVVAKVNEDATNKGVSYSTSDSGVSVDAATGVVTATKVGTYTITATAAGDSSKTATTTVTFYSDMFYITGDENGWSDAGSNSTTEGTNFENFTFTANDTNTVFTLDVVISSANSKFQIMFIGAGSTWDYAINGSNATLSGVTANGNDLVIASVGYYTITLDISKVQPSVSVSSKGSIPTYVATLLKGSESVATSENSTVSNNRYVMSVKTAFVAESEYSFQVNSSNVTIISVSGAVVEETETTTLFTLSDSKLTCVTSGTYRITILYNPTDNSCTASIEQVLDSWVQNSVYSVEAYGNGGTLSTVLTYYNSSSGQYKMYFSYTVSKQWENFSFGFTVDGSWKANIKPNSGISTTNNTTLVAGGSSDNNYWSTLASGTAYFELVFSISGTSPVFESLTISDSDLNTLA